MKSKVGIQRALLLLILWLAFVLRLYGLTRQSIWYDEGLSIYFARGSVIEIVRDVAQSEHPPLHSIVLHWWMACCGDSEFAVRMLSACCGVLTVAWLYRLGRRLFDPWAAGVAVLLLAVSPFAIWFAQETRGYALGLFLAVATVDVALALFPRTFGVRQSVAGPRWILYVAYVVLAAAALYTHLYSAFVLIVLTVTFLLWWTTPAGPRSRRQLIRWLILQGVVLLLFAPWIPGVLAQVRQNASYWHGAVYWKEIVSQTLTAFTVGEVLDGTWAHWATVTLVVLAVLGGISLLWRTRDRLILALLGAWILLPTLILILLTHTRPKFSPRYLLNALPPFLLLAAAGGRWLWRLVQRYFPSLSGKVLGGLLLAAIVVVTGATARSLTNHYFDQRFYRPDMRAVARYIAAHAAEDDLIVLVGGYTYPAFVYYYDGPLPVIPLPDTLLPTTRDPIGPAALEVLNDAIVGRERLWLVLWEPYVSDPMGVITDALEQTYHRLGVGRPFHRFALLCFDVSPGPMLSASPKQKLDVELGDQVRLLGYDLPVREVFAGDTIYLYLYWQALTEMRNDYKAFTQILTPEGVIVAQQDQVAGAAEYPTSHWAPGKIVRNRFLLTVRPDAAPGTYRLIAGLYRPGGKMPRLQASGMRAAGDHVVLGEIEVKTGGEN